MHHLQWPEVFTFAARSKFLLSAVFFWYLLGCGTQPLEGAGGSGVDSVEEALSDKDPRRALGSNVTACMSGTQCPAIDIKQPKWPDPIGTICVSKAQCASGHCVDGYCCDTLCAGVCRACSHDKKGTGVNGICGLIAAATNPDNECGAQGMCDGAGACRFTQGAPCTATNQCFSDHCVDGVCCDNICDQPCYACNAAKKGGGADGTCGQIGNGLDPENECSPGECNGAGACNQPQTPHANGVVCSFDTQCVSGFCVDGVCCENACDGHYEMCNAPGFEGTCEGPLCTHTVTLTPAPPGPFPTNAQWYIGSVKLADFNGDGHLDVAYPNNPYLSILFNQGNGALGSRVDYPGAYFGVATADFNGDDKPDIATPMEGVQGGSYGGVRVWLNQGNGTFGPYVEYPTVALCTEHSILTSDFNGDNKPDIAVACFKYRQYNGGQNYTPGRADVSVLINQGDGTFLPQWVMGYYVNTNWGRSSSDGWIAAADLNGDGYNDLIFADPYQYQVLVMLNQGAGTFAQGTPYSSFFDPKSVLTGDLNGDGHADLVVGDGSSTSVLLNQGNGTLAPKVTYPMMRATALVDLNGDGLLDLIDGRWSSSIIAVQFNQGAGVFGPLIQYPAGMGATAIGDMNSDGRTDVVLVGSITTVLLRQCVP